MPGLTEQLAQGSEALRGAARRGQQQAEGGAHLERGGRTRARRRSGSKGGKSGDYDDWTVPELRKRAKELGMSGYSGKKKAELIDLLRNH